MVRQSESFDLKPTKTNNRIRLSTDKHSKFHDIRHASFFFSSSMQNDKRQMLIIGKQ